MLNWPENARIVGDEARRNDFSRLLNAITYWAFTTIISKTKSRVKMAVIDGGFRSAQA